MKHEIEALQKRWQHEGRFRGLHAGMYLEREGVMLGAKTVLAKRRADGSLESEDARVLTLLSVAYGGPVDPSVVGTIRRASKHAQAGEECMASMHIALARLPKLPDPAGAAQRLFIADGLMEEGVSPRDIWTALEFDPVPLDALEKLFNPSETRVPAGSGRPSGEWTSGKIGSEVRTAAEAIETATTIADWATLIARIGPAAVTFLVATLWPTPAGGRHHEGSVPGRPELRYSWNGDETELDIQEVSDGKVVMRATLGRDGKFRNRGRAIARETKDGVLVDASTLPSDKPKVGSDDDEPQLCPEPPVPDNPGNTRPGGNRGRAYARYMELRVNPTDPTPQGLTYALLNPVSGNPVKFDSCQKQPGSFNDSGTFNIPGSMFEFKSLYGEKFVKIGEPFRESIKRDWVTQATSQVQAAQGRPVIWVFEDQESVDFARDLFSKNELLEQIRLERGHWPEGATWRKLLFGLELYD